VKTIEASSLIYGVCQLAGVPRDQVTETLFWTIRDLLDQRIGLCWEADNWPDLIRVESITPTRDLGDDDSGVSGFLIPDDMGDILGVFYENPRAKLTAAPIGYQLIHTGTSPAVVLSQFSDTVWVKYRLPRPRLTGTVWDSSTSYAIDAQCYYEVSDAGQFYRSLQSVNIGQNPTTSPTYWAQLDIPLIFQGYLVRATYADWLRGEGQHEQALIEEGSAEQMLAHEADRLFRQQGQVTTTTVFTR
jgi:hypothetical protein